MKEKLIKFRDSLVLGKVWIQRANSWISILNSGMILFIVLAQLKILGVEINIGKSFLFIYLGAIIVLVLFGYMEDKAGLYRQEFRISGSRHPYLMEILEKVRNIDKKLEK